MQQLGNLDYLVNALLGFVCGAALLVASGVLTRSWVDFSSAEWGLELDRRAARTRPCALPLRSSPTPGAQRPLSARLDQLATLLHPCPQRPIDAYRAGDVPAANLTATVVRYHGAQQPAHVVDTGE